MVEYSKTAIYPGIGCPVILSTAFRYADPPAEAGNPADAAVRRDGTADASPEGNQQRIIFYPVLPGQLFPEGELGLLRRLRIYIPETI